MANGTSTIVHDSSAVTLAALRAMVGMTSLFSPAFTSRFFGIATNTEARILCKLFGARECALATLLWWAHRRASAEGSPPRSGSHGQHTHARRDLRILLWTGIAIDAVDSVSSAISVWEGSMQGKAIWLVGVGAVAFTLLGSVGLGTM